MHERVRLRASDAEREETVSRLARACAEGRLSFAELGERVEAALSARDFGELETLLADLPARQPLPDSRPAGVDRGLPLRPGNRGFTERFAVAAPRGRVLDRMFDALAPLLERRGYRLVSHSDRIVVFELEYRPGWTFAVAVFAFPVGLLALLYLVRSRLVFALTESRRGCEITVYGAAPLSVRRALTELRT
jgi:hypothetical protein